MVSISLIFWQIFFSKKKKIVAHTKTFVPLHRFKTDQRK